MLVWFLSVGKRLWRDCDLDGNGYNLEEFVWKILRRNDYVNYN